MMRNDYRRALILLRGNAPGVSGHVRLERRTLMGSMYFLLQAPPDCAVLRAALVGRNKGGYYACALGEAARDSRGQAVLSYSFDPRSICGRELEQYQLIAVSCASASGCDIALYGNIAGHADLDWDQVRGALCALYDEGEAAAELPESAPEETNSAAEAEEEQAAPQPEAEEAPQTAGQLLEIDMDAPWPETIEPLRPLFQLSVPMENPPDEEYGYIAVAMPDGSAYPYCAVGVLAEDGAPISVRYGLPSAWSAQPPAGLEDYTWVGDQNQGWWITQVDLYNCSRASPQPMR